MVDSNKGCARTKFRYDMLKKYINFLLNAEKTYPFSLEKAGKKYIYSKNAEFLSLKVCGNPDTWCIWITLGCKRQDSGFRP